MKTITFYVAAMLCLFATRLSAQESFEERAETIAKNIEKISKQEKDSLKIEVESVNQQLQNNSITSAEAETRKKAFADRRAANIESRVAVEQQKLTDLVNEKVEGKLAKSNDRISISFKKGDKDSTETKQNHKRTTSQFVFAFGVNRLVTDDKIDHDNFKWRSDFYEWGLTLNTRLLQNNNLLHLKYGLSLQYNNLRPANDKIFATTADGQTTLVDSGKDLDVARLRYVNLVVPMHLEFDFTKKQVNGETTYFPSHDSFRVGLGGFAGFNVKEKQITKYSEDGHDVRQKEKGDFNVSDFVYGVSAYIGYGEFSVYAKYDLQPVFANNAVDSNNLSMGVRFDFN